MDFDTLNSHPEAQLELMNAMLQLEQLTALPDHGMPAPLLHARNRKPSSPLLFGASHGERQQRGGEDAAERISERIRILQRLVPGGTKMDTASMLDEAIHYVKFLKTQVQSLERAAAANGHRASPNAATYQGLNGPW
ncbi:hypothetical protein ZWY2020_008532 [Hordeum vulgare]|nr:hypothetical protein ZWY2020_008532 [Hordeum vulgare]